MNATQTNPKSAAPSTPAAPPAGSLPDEELTSAPAPQAETPDTGTDAEQVSESDILSALGQLSEGPKAGTETPESASETTPEATDETENPPAESTEDPASQGEEAEGEVGDVDESTPPPAAPAEDPAKGKTSPAQQRINELVARSKSAEESLSKANERLASYEAEQSGRLDAGVLEHFDTTDALAKQRSQVVQLHQKLLKSPQGIELPDPADKTKTVSYDAEGVAELLGQTFWLLHEGIPQRETYLKSKDSFDKAAETAYPWLKDNGQGPGAQVQAVITQNPGLRRIGANYRLVAADALIGQTLRDAGIAVTPQLIAKLKAEGKGAKATTGAAVVPPVVPRRPPPPAPSRAGTVPARATPRANMGQAADKRLSKGNGNVNDLTASIAARL